MIRDVKDNGFVTIHAEEGHKLTNGFNIGTTIHLGIVDGEHNWIQITDEEAIELEKLIQEGNEDVTLEEIETLLEKEVLL